MTQAGISLTKSPVFFSLNLYVSFLAPMLSPSTDPHIFLEQFSTLTSYQYPSFYCFSFGISLATSFNIEHHLVFFLGHDEDWAMFLTAPNFYYSLSLNPHTLTLVSLQLHVSTSVYRTCTVLEQKVFSKSCQACIPVEYSMYVWPWA